MSATTVGKAKYALGKFTPNHEVFVEVNGQLRPIEAVAWHSFESCVVIKAGKPVTAAKE